MTRALISHTVSKTTKPFSLSVVPVSIISTIPSHKPKIGANSTEPSILIISTSIPFDKKYCFATVGYFVPILMCPTFENN